MKDVFASRVRFKVDHLNNNRSICAPSVTLQHKTKPTCFFSSLPGFQTMFVFINYARTQDFSSIRGIMDVGIFLLCQHRI